MNIKDSNRFSFRLMDKTDADLLFELDQDTEVMKYLTNGKMTTREEINDVYIPRMMSYRNEERGWGIWAIHHKATNDFLGWVLTRPMHFFNEQRDDYNLELGWRFKRSLWGQGIATEAARHIALQVSQANAEINRVSAIAKPDNKASIKVMQKLGMTFQSEYLHPDPLGPVQVVLYSCGINELAAHS